MRFHVIAEDDTFSAQALKYMVCAEIMDEMRALFAGCADSAEAWDIARRNTGFIGECAREAARACGYTGPVRASAEICAFEAREYGGATVPEGEYRTLRVTLGEGRGQNWWCILYPEICMPEGYVPGMKVEFYSSVARWLRNLFGGFANG